MRIARAGEITVERCDNIISPAANSESTTSTSSGSCPSTQDQINDLIQKVDDALSPLGARYTITTID